MIPQFEPKAVRRTRVLHLLASGSGIILRTTDANLMDQVIYAARACHWVDPVNQTSGLDFDLAAPPSGGLRGPALVFGGVR